MNDSISMCLMLIPALPLAAAILVAVLGPKVLRENSHWPIIVAFAGSFLCSMWLMSEVRREQNAAAESAGQVASAGYERIVTLWNWANIPDAYQPPEAGKPPADFRIDVTLRADALTSMMLCMVTFVSTLVAIFAVGYMHGESGYWRFFSYIGLFVFSMTMLVSVSNFVLLFVFWEAVGACSYLLIGFWYQKPEAAAAGKKAFLVNRVGDFGFALALFLLWVNYGTLNYHDSMSDGRVNIAATAAGANEAKPDETDARLVPGVVGQSRILSGDFVGGTLATTICLLLLLGACGKSAQFPLHVWLPDAMEGPTPVSALIHAATMVTAGVYMVTRCTPLFMMSPDAQMVVACIGGFTALMAGLIALTQYDLKRVLAYSTISQLGYMFLALGTGSFAGITAGMFHLFTHAFFKALLFLGAGSVMHAMHHIIDMRRFSGLRRIMPQTHWTFLVGCLALSGVFPLSGFWSKDAIVASVHDKAHELAHAGHHEGAELHDGTESNIHVSQIPKLDDATAARYGQIYQALYYVGLFTAFLTAFYTFRGFFLTFYGEEVVPHEAGDHAHESPSNMTVPLMILAGATIAIPFLFISTNFAGNSLVDFIGHAPSLAAGAVHETRLPEKFHLDVAGISTVVAVIGVLLAMYLYMGDRSEAAFAKSIFDFEGARRFMDVEWVAQLRRATWVGSVERGMKSVGLGWLVSVVGLVLGILAVVIALPITIGTYISPYRLSFGKFYFDELYDWFIVKPAMIFASVLAWLDRNLVDALVNLVGATPRAFGGVFRSMQMGLVQFYALAMMLGTVVLLAAGYLWAAN